MPKSPPLRRQNAQARESLRAAAEPKVVEEIVARVNNEIITTSELAKARNAAAEEAQQDCSGKCTPEQFQVAIEDRQKYALRDLIDQSLLVQRGKDMGLSVEADVVKQLDQIRIQNKLPDMDALEKAVTQEGLNWEDFKNNIRNKILTQQVIQREVGSHITIGQEEVQKYYDDAQERFRQARRGGSARHRSQHRRRRRKPKLPSRRKKPKTFSSASRTAKTSAKSPSAFPTAAPRNKAASSGVYKRGELSKELEDKVFEMKKNELTDVHRNQAGLPDPAGPRAL